MTKQHLAESKTSTLSTSRFGEHAEQRKPHVFRKGDRPSDPSNEVHNKLTKNGRPVNNKIYTYHQQDVANTSNSALCGWAITLWQLPPNRKCEMNVFQAAQQSCMVTWQDSTQQNQLPRRCLLAGSLGVLNEENHNSLKRWSSIIFKQRSTQQAYKRWEAHKPQEKPISSTRRHQYEHFSASLPRPHTQQVPHNRKCEMNVFQATWQSDMVISQNST